MYISAACQSPDNIDPDVQVIVFMYINVMVKWDIICASKQWVVNDQQLYIARILGNSFFRNYTLCSKFCTYKHYVCKIIRYNHYLVCTDWTWCTV